MKPNLKEPTNLEDSEAVGQRRVTFRGHLKLPPEKSSLSLHYRLVILFDLFSFQGHRSLSFAAYAACSTRQSL